MHRIVTVGFVTCLLSAAPLVAQNDLLVEGFESLDGWTSSAKELSFDLSGEHVKEGEHSLHLHVEIDHEHAEEVKEVKYPMGWPSVTKVYEAGIDLSEYDFLEFDVYFESEWGIDPDFAMNIITKDGEGRGIYSAPFIDLRDRKWAHEKLCIRDLSRASDFAWLHFYLSESTYDHGAVIDFYIDNLRATKATDYEPPETVPVRHPLAKSDAAILWMEGPTRKVMRTEEVDLSADAEPVLHMSAARNEREAVQLVVQPLVEGGVGEVSVEVGELTGPGGVTIAGDNISWSEVYYVPAKEGPAEGLPDGLPGPKPFTADQQWHYPIWLEVYVPEGTPAGDYVAPVTAHTGRGDLRAELRLHVWDFEVPVEQHLPTNVYIYGPSGWAEDINEWFGGLDYGGFIKEWRPTLVDMLARYRLCPAHLVRPRLPLAYDEEQGKVILKDTTRFEQRAQALYEMGLHFSGMPVVCRHSRDSFMGLKRGTEEYYERIAETFRVAAEYLDEKGWLEGSYFYCLDEEVVSKGTRGTDFDLLNRFLDAVHAGHPKMKILGAETPSPILPGVDIWCIQMNCFDTDVLAEQHALGNEVWWYNGYRDPRPGWGIAQRGASHRALFWITYKYGIDGYLAWTVNRWTENPWEKPNRSERIPAGNYFLLYPNPDGTVSPSIRICMMRDGLEDYEYHWLLAQLAEKLRAAGNEALAAECEQVIERADAFILAYDNCPHIKPNFIYDSRRLLAEQIEKAQAALAAG